MEGRVHRLVQVTFLACSSVAVLSMAEPALAKGQPIHLPGNVTVASHPNKVTVDATSSTRYPGTPAATVAGGGSSCHLEPVTNIGTIFVRSFKKQLSEPDNFPFFLWCNGQMKSLVWLTINLNGGQASTVAADPRTVAMSVRDQMPIPGVRIASNPGRGLVGVKTWFWITGYNGRALQKTTTAFGSAIQVRAQPKRYRWDFGDGTVIETRSPGRPYPKRPAVIHMYQRSSAGLPDGYAVRVTFVFAVSYRVNGGPWQALPGISRSASRDFPVQEAQAVIQR